LGALFRHGVFAGAEHRKVLTSQLKFVVDIGANKGQFALACRKWAPNAKVISFEPLPSPYKIYSSLFVADHNVIIHNVAIGNYSATTKIHISAREDSSSLFPIGQEQTRNYPGTDEVGTIDVRIATLNSFINSKDIHNPAMLKIDVQGYEMNVLLGCEDLLPRFEFIYCECSFIELYTGQTLALDIIDWLRRRGFIMKGLRNISYTRSRDPLQADLLFEKI
jgi:FkbM family methyltransferase